MSQPKTWTAAEILKALDLQAVQSGVSDGAAFFAKPGGPELPSHNPATGELIATLIQGNDADYDQVMAASTKAFQTLRTLPAPARGEIVRQLGDEFRKYKEPLGALISLEMGKIYSEGLGEVQEMIDICDFAVGLSRQLYGLSMHSERPGHRMYEQWHPIGPVAVITAFNFPMAVWAWNAMLAMVCGDTTVWKPSSKVPLCAVAVQKIVDRVMARHNMPGVFTLIVGRGKDVGERINHDKRIPLVSFTGSVRMGRHVGEACAKRFGRSLLELGGNNGIIVMDDANLDLALRAVAFGAAGTAGQRCTTTRRLFLQKGIAAGFVEKLKKAYASLPIGSPLEPGILVGPLIDDQAVKDYEHAISEAVREGGEVVYGGKRVEGAGNYVMPTLIKAAKQLDISCEETFAPILYIFEFEKLEDAIQQHNAVAQGLSSAIFTTNIHHSEAFLSAAGSDCGIANVNIGTSGAEIGGAFGGEKETGGGRESGSDAWKVYMRRQTCTINYSTNLPLAQGVKFDI
ncbi:MAG TPA: aldehyde dehydrogenase family protein [Holophagaceae bacterium]|nr:aldehyde dehydrogenase family protein [Holophagaceae bacterium]